MQSPTPPAAPVVIWFHPVLDSLDEGRLVPSGQNNSMKTFDKLSH